MSEIIETRTLSINWEEHFDFCPYEEVFGREKRERHQKIIDWALVEFTRYLGYSDWKADPSQLWIEEDSVYCILQKVNY